MLTLLGLWMAPGVASAQIGSERYAAIVVDARTGRPLIAANADEPRYPASLTKMMTLYMLFTALQDGTVQLNTPIRMSAEAASRPPSKLGLRPGSTLTVEQAILALVTKSANDVAAAVGEALGGSEERFGQLMTLRARAMGMSRTTFRNASGLPDPDNITTARDMATLGLRLMRDFPDRYHYFSRVSFNWGRAVIRNHNRMLGDYEGVDGIKTGYIRDSGFNIVTSAQREGIRLVGVTMGGSSWVERDRHMGALLDQGFAQMGVTRPSGATVAGAAVGAAPAAVVSRRPTAASRNATARTTPGRGQGTAAARAARQAVTAQPQRRTTSRTAVTTRRVTVTTQQPRRRTVRATTAVEQGSRGTSSLGTARNRRPLAAPVPRRRSVQEASR